jgi:hypothetical protein
VTENGRVDAAGGCCRGDYLAVDFYDFKQFKTGGYGDGYNVPDY